MRFCSVLIFFYYYEAAFYLLIANRKQPHAWGPAAALALAGVAAAGPSAGIR